MPFVVEHTVHQLWRGWNELGPTWVPDIKQAIHYWRREDAERVHAEDEDAGFIRDLDDNGEAIPNGPYGVMEIPIAKRWAVFRADEEEGRITELLLIGESVPEQERELIGLICAAALNRMLPEIKDMRRKHTAFIARLVAELTTPPKKGGGNNEAG